jgi:hypothetical protein
MLGIGRRQLYRLLDQEQLPMPVKQAGRNLWREEDVERLRQQRLAHRPTNRQNARSGMRVVARVRRERCALARAFLDCWQRCSLALAVDLVRRHGAVEGPLDLNIEQLARCTAELEYAVRLVRGLR